MHEDLDFNSTLYYLYTRLKMHGHVLKIMSNVHDIGSTSRYFLVGPLFSFSSSIEPLHVF